VSREYEQYQLELVARSYRQRGFEVRIQDSVGNSSFQFDAYARNAEGEVVIIQLVNALRSDSELQRQLAALVS